jgi:hypothetical protein
MSDPALLDLLEERVLRNARCAAETRGQRILFRGKRVRKSLSVSYFENCCLDLYMKLSIGRRFTVRLAMNNAVTDRRSPD